MANMTTREQYLTLQAVTDNLVSIFDGIYGEYDEDMDETITETERLVHKLIGNYVDMLREEEQSKDEICHRYSNCYILRDREDGEVIVKTYDDDKADVMMRKVSKHICFSDCDDTFEVIKIVYHGREVEYTGWQPGMVMSYEFTATGDLAWEESFPQYDH